MSQQVLTISLKRQGDKLVLSNELMKEQYRIFVASLDEGAEVEVLFERKAKTNTKAQLAKIHVCIKELADEQGSSINEMKTQVKTECGMVYKENGKQVIQSFADCSKEELSNVIETIIQMGRFMNINFEGTLRDQ
jgi:hypothetical protein